MTRPALGLGLSAWRTRAVEFGVGPRMAGSVPIADCEGSLSPNDRVSECEVEMPISMRRSVSGITWLDVRKLRLMDRDSNSPRPQASMPLLCSVVRSAPLFLFCAITISPVLGPLQNERGHTQSIADAM
jgi:hypothetical protein